MGSRSDKRNGRKLDKVIGESIGARIRLARTSNKMSQRSLAEALNTEPNYISRIESATANASLQLIYDIAEKLQCSVHSLLPPTKAMEDSLNISVPYDLNFLLKNATPYQRNMILQHAIWYLQQPLPY